VPEDRESSTGVVLLASRARDRAHRNGLWVRTARTLAGDAMYVLRLDYPGVGNSTGTPRLFGQKDVPSWAVENACRYLVEQTPVRRIILAGTCYGGRVVLDAATRIPEVTAVALVVAPVLRPLSAQTRIRMRAARLLGRHAAPVPAPDEGARPGEGAPVMDRRVDPTFTGAMRRFLPRGRVYFLYGDRDHFWEELRFALDRLRLPASRYEIELVPGEIDSFRSIEMQSLTHERLTSWCRRSADAFRERA
jgi:pimeloyl-ACP methyl ester carboxylesterase